VQQPRNFRLPDASSQTCMQHRRAGTYQHADDDAEVRKCSSRWFIKEQSLDNKIKSCQKSLAAAQRSGRTSIAVKLQAKLDTLTTASQKQDHKSSELEAKAKQYTSKKKQTSKHCRLKASMTKLGLEMPAQPKTSRLPGRKASLMPPQYSNVKVLKVSWEKVDNPADFEPARKDVNGQQ